MYIDFAIAVEALPADNKSHLWANKSCFNFFAFIPLTMDFLLMKLRDQ